MLRGLAPARRRFVLAVGLVLSLAVVAIAAAVVVPRLSGSETIVEQQAPGPVVLLSGYGGRVGSVDPLTAELDRLGRGWVVVPPVEGNRGDLAAQAQALDDVVAGLRAEGAQTVDIVGYSLGGVVARLWVRDLGGAGVARRVVSIGSPQHGTEVSQQALDAVGSCPTACVQVAPESRLLRGLNAGDETPPGPLWVSVFSNTDEVVVPGDSGELDGALNLAVQTVCPGPVAHGALPSHPVVLALLADALGVEEPSIPDEVAC